MTVSWPYWRYISYWASTIKDIDSLPEIAETERRP
jgi:hypothetical protein